MENVRVWCEHSVNSAELTMSRRICNLTVVCNSARACRQRLVTENVRVWREHRLNITNFLPNLGSATIFRSNVH